MTTARLAKRYRRETHANHTGQSSHLITEQDVMTRDNSKGSHSTVKDERGEKSATVSQGLCGARSKTHQRGSQARRRSSQRTRTWR